MIPWTLLDTAEIPGVGLSGKDGSLRLLQRGTEFSIRLAQCELMNSRLSGSEEDLATLSAERIRGRERPRVLIGGLGMGFTLRAALAAFPPGAELVVAELVPAVVAWARGPMAAMHGDSLSDPRVEIKVVDVIPLVAERKSAWDAILLDVDNGPDGLTRSGNDGLYDHAGLARARTALKPGGVLAIWSSGPDAGFTRRLRQSGLMVEEVKVRARKGHGTARHVIWFATKPTGTGRTMDKAADATAR